MTADDALARVRRLCLALPETNERPSHSAPTFFVRDKHPFVYFQDDHHGDGRLAIWAAAADGMQHTLVEGDPGTYFVPAYVGYRGWIGVELGKGIAEDELAGVIEDAWLDRAPKTLRRQIAGE